MNAIHGSQQAHENFRKATFAGGCFWCVEAAFDGIPGVLEATSGYTGGDSENPTYEEVSSGVSGHLEAVQVRFDPTKVTFGELLDVFWRQIDPSDEDGQFADRGSQYGTAIFYHDAEQRRVAEQSIQTLNALGLFQKKIATQLQPAGPFYPAEAYHQDYAQKNAGHYESYKKGSGRSGFVERVWGKVPPKALVPLAPPKAQASEKSAPEELKRKLPPLSYHVTQEGGTEPPFRNAYWNEHREGIYVDVVTGEPLFSSKHKFDSGSGWPSFTRPIEKSRLVLLDDLELASKRTEVRSKLGDSHLGHVFDDGPGPEGKRYCINSAALRFIPKSELEAQGYGQYLALFAN
jgi:peptide methionine sulfoxide reductase msrA/msrB